MEHLAIDAAAGVPAISGVFAQDAAAFSAFWSELGTRHARLPPKPMRDDAAHGGSASVLAAGRAARRKFLGRHVETLYARLTGGLSRFVRVEQLAADAAREVPGLVPSAATLAAEAQLPQRDKEGHEYDQGLLFNAILGHPRCGLHLCHAMLLPRSASAEHLGRFAREGRVDLGTAVIERQGTVATVLMKNPRFLNAEDETTLAAVEIAVDLALLDHASSVCVLRGARIEGGKYDGQAVFSTGINLTRLYRGEISYLWYLIRDLGFVNKLYRGLARPEIGPDEVHGDTLEKIWIAAVEKFAIGGGCQYLLAIDYAIGASDAYATLPARKEGIIPGVANMRLPRFVGDRLARQLIMNERRLDCASPEAKLLFDEVVPPEEMDAAVARVAARLSNSGVVSAAANRRAFRVTQEPLDAFRSYMAVYAREQAQCHFSPALIRNLEQFWDAANRNVTRSRS